MQALHPLGLPRRVPDRRDRPHRARHGRRAGGRLQRLRLLRPRVPVRRARPARDRGRRPGLEVHALLRPHPRGHRRPACAQACPTESIQYGPLDELRERAAGRLDEVVADGFDGARLYGHDPTTTASAASARSSCCSTSPRSTACRRDPVDTTRDLPEMWRAAAAAAGALALGTLACLIGGRR